MNEITDIKRRAGIQKISQAENPEGYLQAVLDAKLEFDDFRKSIQHLTWTPEIEAKFTEAFGFIDAALKTTINQVAIRKRNS
jgi:hypothetical protein